MICQQWKREKFEVRKKENNATDTDHSVKNPTIATRKTILWSRSAVLCNENDKEANTTVCGLLDQYDYTTFTGEVSKFRTI